MIKCFICHTECEFYFEKKFTDFGLKEVEYFKCPECEFVFSKTHNEMYEAEWQKINLTYHEYIENPVTIKAGKRRPPPYFEQASMINTFCKNDFINLDNCLDWGSGYGTLSKILLKYHGIYINNYDEYMIPKQNFLSKEEISERKFDVVINSAVFEHITHRKYLDEINSCVSDEGCLIFHTVVGEKIPKDPDWFYLLPVHCAFHTNKSMSILMKQWGYCSSLYCPFSKMWVLFKKPVKNIKSIVESINMEFQTEYIFYKDGFMDYWK